MLFALGYEHMNRTEHLVYSSKTGRRIVLKKYIAAVIVGMSAYLMLAILTLALHFALNHYGGVWNSNVSSSFNAIKDIVMGSRPFVTWHSFTVSSYMCATVVLSLGIMLCFSLAGFVAGTEIRNSYAAFSVFFLVTALAVTLPMILPVNSDLMFVLVLTPIWLLLKQPLWFTDGGLDILWENFEILGFCFSIAILAALATIAAIRFRRREIT
jgi:hypothetical protein